MPTTAVTSMAMNFMLVVACGWPMVFAVVVVRGDCCSQWLLSKADDWSCVRPPLNIVLLEACRGLKIVRSDKHVGQLNRRSPRAGIESIDIFLESALVRKVSVVREAAVSPPGDGHHSPARVSGIGAYGDNSIDDLLSKTSTTSRSTGIVGFVFKEGTRNGHGFVLWRSLHASGPQAVVASKRVASHGDPSSDSSDYGLRARHSSLPLFALEVWTVR